MTVCWQCNEEVEPRNEETDSVHLEGKKRVEQYCPLCNAMLGASDWLPEDF